MVKRCCRWFRGGAEGLEVVQIVKRWCRWFRDGSDGLEVVKMV